jgi:hypothetical protein
MLKVYGLPVLGGEREVSVARPVRQDAEDGFRNLGRLRQYKGLIEGLAPP